ncbi:MAG TPA: response regulator [Methanoregulaceae archaeon]|nr:response regulator [Methanoregulaceae archaeon]
MIQTYTILVVDDNPSIVDIFVNMLQQGGYMTLTASSGEKALQILEKNRPDMILLDIMMEPLDGWQTLERIKAGPPSVASIPVLMLTAKQLTIGEAERFGLSIEDYINKPITRRALYDSIERFFRRRDRMETKMQIAGESGADPEMIREYRTLCRTTDVQRRLIRILEQVANTGDVSIEQHAEIYSAVKAMKETVMGKTERLNEIRKQFENLGISPDEGENQQIAKDF